MLPQCSASGDKNTCRGPRTTAPTCAILGCGSLPPTNGRYTMALLFLAFVLTGFPLVVGAGATLLWGRARHARRPAGLVVHSLTRRSPIDCSYVSPDTLEKTLRLLQSKGYIFTRVSERTQSDVPAGKRVILTFDDGLEDCYTKALPILTALGIPASFFPIAGCLGAASSNADVYGTQRYLSASEVRQIADRGHEIGSHSLTHADLVLLPPDELREELRRSKAILEDIVGHQVTSISFPFGSCNDHVWRAAQECGYRTATVYGTVSRCPQAQLVYGVYPFDSAEQIFSKVVAEDGIHTAVANARMMPHFARGTALWRFRRSYRLLGTER
ncbi:MAG: polysaccharide deacetylase family protein [Chitinivibrionales bacterium]|nr:polysaccharide deacetylase family protein [Chitinivibrionales bacterium]